MTGLEKEVLAKEKKQLRAFIGCLREENNALGNKLAEMIPLVSNIRAHQLGIELMLKELEAKLRSTA